MSDIDQVREYLSTENGLATISTTQSDGRVLSSIANCGVIDHPVTGLPCVALVSMGSAARLTHVRRGSEVTIAIRRGWTWRAVTGPAEIIGPDDLDGDFNAESLRVLLRDVFTAAGGTHDDFDEYDRAMAEEQRAALLVAPDRIIGNLFSSRPAPARVAELSSLTLRVTTCQQPIASHVRDRRV